MPAQPPPQCAEVMMLFVTTPVKVAVLPALDFPMVMAFEPLPGLTQSVEILFVMVLPLIVPVMLLVPEPWNKTPLVLVMVQLLSVPFMVDPLLAWIETPLLNSLLNVQTPPVLLTFTVMFAVRYESAWKPSDCEGFATDTLSTTLFVKLMVAVPVLLVIKTLWPKSLS